MEERQPVSGVPEGASPDPAGKVAAGDDAIEVGAEALGQGEIELSGDALSEQERERGYALATWLSGLVPRLSDDDAAATLSACADVWSELGERDQALEAAREASRRSPRSHVAAWTWRRMATSPGEVIDALEREAATAEEGQAVLETERGLQLMLRPGATGMAAAAFRHAVATGKAPLAEIALERLELEAGRPAIAAEHAAAAASVTDGALRAELLARAGLHGLRGGDAEIAARLAHQALGDGVESPTVELLLEALSSDPSLARELVAFRLGQLERGAIGRLEGWFDIGVVARYRLADPDLAVEAFGAALGAARGEAAELACREELLPLLVDASRWDEAIETAEAIAKDVASPVRRAHLFERIGAWKLEHRGDEEGALEAFRAALREEPSHRPSLESAGRILQRRGATDELVRMHRREALAADDEREAAAALRRAGELLVAHPEGRAEGIAMLEESRVADPDHLGAFEALAKAVEQEGDAESLCTLLEAETERARTDPARRGALLARVARIASVDLADPSRARRALRALEEVTAGHPPGDLDVIADRFRDAEDWDGLALVLERRAEHRTSGALAASDWVELAAVHERREDLRATVAALRRAVDTAPPTHGALRVAGRTFLRLGLYEELLPLLEQGSERGSPRERAEWLGRAARILDAYLNRPDDAVERLLRARALASSPDHELHLEALLTRQCRWDELATSDAGPLRRGMWAEAAGDDARALAAYAEAVAAGHDVARRLHRRLLAAVGSWADLEAVEDVIATDDPAARLRALHAALHRGPNESARRHLDALVATDAPEAWLAVAPLLAVGGEAPSRATVRALERLAGDAEAQELRGGCLHLLGHRGALDHASILDHEPAHPVALPAVTDELRDAGALVPLAARLRAALADPELHPELEGPLAVALAEALERLGQLQEALDVLAAEPALPRRGWITWHRIGRALEREDEVLRALEALAATPPEGAERALALRLLDAQRADGALSEALRSHPRDYDALRDLRQRAGESGDFTDALTRAFEAEEDESMVVSLGNALTAQLLREGRFERGHGVSERVLATAPDSLDGLMLRAEIDDRREAFVQAAAVLLRVADHGAVPDDVRLEALRRRAFLCQRRLDDEAGARAILDDLASDPGVTALQVRLQIAASLGDRARITEVLSLLAHHDQLSEVERGSYALRLCNAYEATDVEAAFTTLAGITAPPLRRKVVERCFALAVRSGRWREACPIIARALDEAGHEEHGWLVAMRTRLVRVLREELADEESAGEQEAILQEAGASDPDDLEQLANAVAEREPERALALHRRLLEIAPQRVGSYRAIRGLALRLDDELTAYRAESVLVGVGLASDEERYFHKQRRGRFGLPLEALPPALAEALLPERETAGFQLMRVLDPLLADVFPLTPGQYGAHPDEAEPSLVQAAAGVARWFGVERYRLVIGASRLRPAVAWAEEPLLVVPRTLGDGLLVEQRFVLASLFARVVLGLVATDVAREQALTDHELVAWLEAGRCIALGWPVGADPIVRDLFDRLQAVASAEVREALVALGPALEAEVLDGPAMRRAAHRAAARAAAVAAGDPAVALRCLGSHPVSFGAEDAEWPVAGWAGAAFLVSEIASEHWRP